METKVTPLGIVTVFIILLVPFAGIVVFMYDITKTYLKNRKS